jgi:spore coat polysaccharide biosynthesis protein SpsF (cytidylyltransferase family)
MQLRHYLGQPAEEESEADRSQRRRLGRYLVAGGAVLAATALAKRRRRRRRREEREMVTIEIRDEPATPGK